MPRPPAHRQQAAGPVDAIKGRTVSIVDVLVARQPPIDRLPEHEPVDRVLAPAGVAERARGDIGQPERVIRLAHRRQTAVPTELRSPEFQPHTAVEIHPIAPLGTRTFQAIRKTRPSLPTTHRFSGEIRQSQQQNKRIARGMRVQTIPSKRN